MDFRLTSWQSIRLAFSWRVQCDKWIHIQTCLHVCIYDCVCTGLREHVNVAHPPPWVLLLRYVLSTNWASTRGWCACLPSEQTPQGIAVLLTYLLKWDAKVGLPTLWTVKAMVSNRFLLFWLPCPHKINANICKLWITTRLQVFLGFCKIKHANGFILCATGCTWHAVLPHTFWYGMNMCKRLPSQRPHCVSVVDWKPPAHAVDCIDSDFFGSSTS